MFLALSVGFLWLCVKANFESAAGRFILHMDERITFDGIRNILHPKSFLHFLWSVFDGGDQRYGRILWNVSALFSFIPEYFWSDKGQIVSTRLTQTVFVLGSYFILVFAFLKNSWMRLFALASLLSVPSSIYFSSMPKPEPIQLFLLSVFFVLRHHRIGKEWISWMFLGAALGAKVSLIPLVPLLFCLSVWENRFSKFDRKRFCHAALSILFGVFVASPPAVLQFKMWVYIFISQRGHGLDDDSVSAATWIKYLSSEWLGTNPTVFYLLLIVAICLVTVIPRKAKSLSKDPPKLFGLSSFVLAMPILLSVKRIWDHYLHIPVVLALIALFIVLERVILHFRKISFQFGLAVVGGIFLLYIVSFSSIPKAYKSLIMLSERTQTKEFQTQFEEYSFLIEYLKAEKSRRNQTLRVYLDPSLFQLESNDDYEITEFWGPFLNFRDGADVIAMYKELTPDVPLPAPTSASYLPFKQSYEEFERHVEKNQKSCLESPCYRSVPTDFSRLRIFAKIKD